jgi:hypothetical protein
LTIDGNIKEIEPGIGVIAKDIKIPVIPVRIDGLHDILHNGILPLVIFAEFYILKPIYSIKILF